MSGPPRSRSKSSVAPKKVRSWLDVILDIDDDEPARVQRRRPRKKSAAEALRAEHASDSLLHSRSLPSLHETAERERDTGAGSAPAIASPTASAAEEEQLEEPWEAAASPTVLYSRAQAFAEADSRAFTQESIESAYLEVKKEMSVRLQAEEEAPACGTAQQWQQEALTLQLQVELQGVRGKLLEAGRELEVMRGLLREQRALAAEQLQSERARREQAQADLALVRRERDLLTFSAGLGDVTAAQRAQEERARELLEGEVRVLKQSLLLAHEQATGGGDGVAACLAAVKALLADVAHGVEDFQRSGAGLREAVHARQKLEVAAVTKLRELLQHQQPTLEERQYHEHVERAQEALHRIEALYDLAVSESAPPPIDDVAVEWRGGQGSAVSDLNVSSALEALETGNLRKSTSDSELAVDVGAVAEALSPALSYVSPRAYASNPESLPSTASLLLFGGVPPEQ